MVDGQDPPRPPSAIERLSAAGPFGPDERQLMLYGRLIGAWDIDWVAFDGSGEAVERRRGEWHFAWVLGGRGVQDVIWAVGAPREEDGTTLRCWDAQLGAWRVVFMSPADSEFVTLVGRPAGERIVQEVIDRAPGAPAERWTFSEITEAAFLWEAEVSSDGGRTWTVTHEMRATRRVP
jgi:hypothetical protein